MMADLKVIPDGHRQGRPTFTVIISDYGPVTLPKDTDVVLEGVPKGNPR